MKRIALGAVIALMTLVVPAGHAEMEPGAVSITPFVGGYFFQNEEKLKDPFVYGLRFGNNISPRLGFEGVFYYGASERELQAGFPDVDLYGYGLELLYHFQPKERLVPFVAAGLGGTKLVGPQGSNRAMIDYGAGLKYFLNDNVALRADARHVIPLNRQNSNLLVSFGINFYFGGEKETLTAARAALPPAAPPPAAASPRDADGDGVEDARDRCPDTPLGVQVDRDGCPVDSDGDGVPDYLDRCPGTPAGFNVDRDGCLPPIVLPPSPPQPKPMEESIIQKGRVTLNVEFDFDESVVKREYHDEIAELASVMRKHPTLLITLEGHTDSTGDPAYNMRLSGSRADAVRSYLIERFGIEGARLDVKAYGETRPVESNATIEGRRRNRRVEAAAEYPLRK